MCEICYRYLNRWETFHGDGMIYKQLQVNIVPHSIIHSNQNKSRQNPLIRNRVVLRRYGIVSLIKTTQLIIITFIKIPLENI